MRCFPEQSRVGAVDCCPRRLCLCTMQLPEARFGPSVRLGIGAELPNWLLGHGWGVGIEGLRAPNPASPEGKTGGSGCRPPRPPAKQQGPGSHGQASPALPFGERGTGRENGLRCFLDPRRVGAVVCCPRRVSLCRMQLPEARLGRSVRWGLGAERPSWPRGHGWGLGAEGLRAPNPASPRRRTRGEWVSGTGEPQQSSRAQGARGSPAPLCPLESGGPGAKTACVAFLS